MITAAVVFALELQLPAKLLINATMLVFAILQAVLAPTLTNSMELLVMITTFAQAQTVANLESVLEPILLFALLKINATKLVFATQLLAFAPILTHSTENLAMMETTALKLILAKLVSVLVPTLFLAHSTLGAMALVFAILLQANARLLALFAMELNVTTPHLATLQVFAMSQLVSAFTFQFLMELLAMIATCVPATMFVTLEFVLEPAL